MKEKLNNMNKYEIIVDDNNNKTIIKDTKTGIEQIVSLGFTLIDCIILLEKKIINQ